MNYFLETKKNINFSELINLLKNDYIEYLKLGNNDTYTNTKENQLFVENDKLFLKKIEVPLKNNLIKIEDFKI